MTFDHDDFPDGWHGLNTWNAVSETLHLTRTKRPERGSDEERDMRRARLRAADLRWRSKPDVRRWLREKSKATNARIYADPVLLARRRAQHREWYHKRKSDPDFIARQAAAKAAETAEHREARLAKNRALMAANKERYAASNNARRRAARAAAKAARVGK